MNDIVASVQKMYDESGVHFSKTREKTYGKESSNWPVTQKYLDKLKRGQAVLDVGCGDGRLLSGLPRGVKYLGIDFSQTLLTIAREKYPTREFRFGNIVETKAWRDLGKYEAVFCVATLHHVPEREQQKMILQKMKEVTKKGGRMFLSVWNLWNGRMVQRVLEQTRVKAGEVVEIPFDKQPGRYVVAMDLAYLVKLATEAGWEIEEVFYADREGKRGRVLTGMNLVVTAVA